jgi:hypothetical protein
MPVAHPSASPFKNRLMRHAAADGMLVSMRCGLCRKTLHFWAADLVTVLGPGHPVHVPPWPCSRCRTAEHIDMRWTVPSPAMLQGLTVRRPIRKIEKWLWQNEKA